MTTLLLRLRPPYALIRSISRFSQQPSSRWLSSSSSSSFQRPNPSNPTSASKNNKNLSLYLWGTDTKGSVHGWMTEPAAASGSGGPIVSGTTGETAKVITTPPPPGLPTALDVPTLAADWTSKLVPPPPSNVSIQNVFAGPTDTAILLSNGACYVCGDNKHGQLGLGHTKPVARPTLLVLPNQARVRSISLGVHSSAIISTDGDLYTFGHGGSAFSGLGVLGHGSAESYHTPKLVESLVEDGCTAQQVHVGEHHMTVLTTEGEVLTCGSGSYGKLGNYDTLDQLYLEPVELLQNMKVTHIAGGKSFSLALDGGEGIIYGWGQNDKGQLGTGYGMAVDMYSMAAIPSPVEMDELQGRRVTQIAAGHSHAACVTESGELFYWGMSLQLEPMRVVQLLHTRIVQVACGQDYTLALDDKGDLYALGKGKSGVLGKGSIKILHQPEVVEALQAKQLKVNTVSAGWHHVVSLVEGAEEAV